ncbi:Brix-domain-containing protein [Coniophora puteana RWD-64-598 SS2]|uniref:Brix-domain-containing protein n=1 Tax=Coniophora puteana (strain RWD-64-598) TaxID=741705 RepID=A0A5M3MJG4_CONPW|nr:Brix-domain-containing protein [Coniophora puteana RWD-64-598 SS2]EIW79253.1 Brix-domain-containing protein [Coniophora puteana RWD-64-598 SS2]
MPPARFQPSQIKNKIKREEVTNKQKKAKNQQKLQKRLEQAKLESTNPAAKKRRLLENVPRTLDNTREHDPSTVVSTDGPLSHEFSSDIASDPFAEYFTFTDVDPTVPPKVLITTSPKVSKGTHEFCDELVGIFPGAEYIRRKKGKGFEVGRIAGWAAGRGYKHMVVVNEDMKKPNAITLIYLPNGPMAYFKLTSVELTKQIYGHARATPHNPELVLNNFSTSLGHAVGRMFQTLFPPLPEFQGRQVVTLHNQRDFLFFRRHRYAFRSTEKVALQEIGPRFTLKLRWLKNGLPAVMNFGASPASLQIDTAPATDEDEQAEHVNEDEQAEDKDEEKPEDAQNDEVDEAEEHTPHESTAQPSQPIQPPKENDYLWMWKPELETTRRTFFL